MHLAKLCKSFGAWVWENLGWLRHCSTPGDGKAAQVRARHSAQGCRLVSPPFPALSRETIPGLGLPQGGSSQAGRSAGSC